MVDKEWILTVQNIMAALITCCLVGSAIAYCEIKTLLSWQRVATYAGCGLMASMFAASPLLWEWFDLYSGYVEQIAVAISLSVGLWVMVGLIRGNDE